MSRSRASTASASSRRSRPATRPGSTTRPSCPCCWEPDLVAERQEQLERENRVLERRLRRLEANVHQLEEFQDSNATLLTRVLEDLEAERARSRQLLLNVL